MSRFTSFDGLPLIVHDRILRSLPSPKDVANLIRASPGSLYAFTTGRRSILLSAMQNSLSLENQHLMNLVMAAPHYYKHRNSDSTPITSTSASFDSVADFNLALENLFFSLDLQPLTPATLDCSIKLYTVMDTMIRDYHSFTLARSEGRVPMLSTPEASRIRQKQFQRYLQMPDDEEKSRTWRGFLIYELLCLMHGVPSIAAAARGKDYRASKTLLPAREVSRRIPTCMQEEVLCVWQYVQEQYDLAFNSLLESFELAIGELGRKASGLSPSSSTHVQPIIEQRRAGDIPVQHLFEPPFMIFNNWTSHISILGLTFLQRFLSWDSSTRLDFVRITYPFLGRIGRHSIQHFIRSELDAVGLIHGNLGWTNPCVDPLSKLATLQNSCKWRLRAVGWIFRKEPPRLFTPDPNRRGPYARSDIHGRIRRHVRLQGRPHLEETPVEKQEWERTLQHFGPSFSERQLNDIKGLFKSIGALDSGRIADTVSALRHQDEEEAPSEVKEGGN